MIRKEAEMPISRFTQVVGIPRRTYTRWTAKARAGNPPKGPWPAPAVDAIEPIVEKYAQHWAAWGHRKIHALMRVDGYEVSASTVERAMRRRNLLQPQGYRQQHRCLAQARRAAFRTPPDRPFAVWQLDFTEYETAAGGIWRTAGCADYYSKYEYGWHHSTTCTTSDAIAAVQIAITEAEALAGKPLHEILVHDDNGNPVPITLVTDNGSAFKSKRFAAFIASRPELNHVRTRKRSPGQNGVRERAFGSLKYEHLYRMEINDGPSLAAEAEYYRQIFNTIRPHEALGMRRPIEIHQQHQQTQLTTPKN